MSDTNQENNQENNQDNNQVDQPVDSNKPVEAENQGEEKDPAVEKPQEGTEEKEEEQNPEEKEEEENQEDKPGEEEDQKEDSLSGSKSLIGGFEQKENKTLNYILDKLISLSVIETREDFVVTEDVLASIREFIGSEKSIQMFLKRSEDKIETNFNLQQLYSRSDKEDDVNFIFCLKREPVALSEQNIESTILIDYVSDGLLKFTFDKMNEVYIPLIIKELKWPEGIKEELITNLHKFMINLSNTYYGQLNKIVLYIPKEDLLDKPKAKEDKSLVSRLENIMIEWTTQIRDFINNQEANSSREDFDVLKEIRFWDSRNNNLSNISNQLNNNDLQTIIDILNQAKPQSDNLKGFNNLKSTILEERNKAKNIHRFVVILSKPCEDISDPETKLEDIPLILRDLMDRIRLVTEYCSYYDNVDKVADLIKKVSIQLMLKFKDTIRKNMDNIRESYSKDLHIDLKMIKRCIYEWKIIYKKSKMRVERYESASVQNLWEFEQKDSQNIFYDLDSFEKRCQNIEDICLCQLQFGKDKTSKLPVFGGTKRYEIYKQLKDIEDKFDDQMAYLFSSKNKVDDIKNNKWQEEFRVFSKHVEGLEDMFKNCISSSFKRIRTLEDAVNIVENFYSMAKRTKIKNFIQHDIVIEVIQIAMREVEKLKIVNY